MDANVLQASHLLRILTRNGGAALARETGVLEEGRKADLIVIDLDDPTFTPLVSGNRNQLYSHLAFAAYGRAVRTVVIDGSLVMDDRDLMRIDEERVLREANAAFQRILERAEIGSIETVV